jgi:hypothetical protein
MSEFVFHTGGIGAGRLHSYPETRGGGNALLAFARNFASGPLEVTTIPTAGIEVPWDPIYSGATPGVDVPITPRATGLIRVSGVLDVKNSSDTPETVNLVIRIGAIELAFPFLESNSLESGASEAIPFLAETLSTEAFPLGATVNVRVFVTSTSDTDVQLIALASSIEVQEVAAPTG